MTRTNLRGLSLGLLSGVALLAASLTFGDPAFAQSQRSSGGGHDSGGGHETTEHDSGGQGGRGGSGAGRGEGRGQGGQSVRDVFEDLEEGERGASEEASRGQRGGDDTARGGRPADTGTAEEEDSDRPEWAGTPGRDGKPGQPNPDAGTKMGDMFGDMYAILRDVNGVPIMTQLPDGTWVVQPIDAEGNLVPLDEEGHPVDETLTVEVELGRLNIGRSPDRVLDRRLDEALAAINDADSITVDASGRLVLTVDGVEKTIDSPLENLALYVELMNTGTIAGVTDTTKFSEDLAHLVDGTLTMEDLLSAASFLAAASDKTVPMSIDKVAYMNLIMDLEGTLTDAAGNEYVDFSDFTYDRESVYGDATAEVLILQDGVYVPTIINIYETVFSSENYVSDDGGIDGFTQAADDARAVINYIHEYEVPAEAAAVQ